MNKEIYSELPYVIVRTETASAFFCYLAHADGKIVEMLNARRIHVGDIFRMWERLSTDATMNITNIGLSMPCQKITLSNVTETLYCSTLVQSRIENSPSLLI